jgi:hypothetical protein
MHKMIDGRTISARRHKSLCAQYASDLSADPATITSSEMSLISAASAIQVQLEAESARMLRGEETSGERIAALSDNAQRIWHRLTARRGTNAVLAE